MGGAGGGAQPSAFEQNVLSTLEALKESMNQLKSNPAITQTEVRCMYVCMYLCMDVCDLITP